MRTWSFRNRAIAALTVISAALLLSCSGGGDGGESSDGKPAGRGEKAARDQAGAESPDRETVSGVAFRTVDGSERKISDYSGKILMVNFMATWNADSKELVPIMNEVQRKFHANLTVLGVIVDAKSPAQAVSFRNASDAKFEFLLPDGDPGSSGANRKLPTTHVVTREGLIIKRFDGLHRQKQYEEFILAMYRRRM